MKTHRIIVLLILIILLVSCTSNNSINEIKSSDENNHNSTISTADIVFEDKLIKTIEFDGLSTYVMIDNEISSKELSLVKGYMGSPELYSDNYIESWKNYIESNFNININIVHRGFSDEDLVTFAKEQKGLITLLSLTELVQLKEAGLLEPLNDLILDNRNLNYFSRLSLIPYSDFDNKTWAIPSSGSMTQYVRVYSKDSIDNTIGYVPNDLNSFYEYCNMVSNTDVNMNGKNDNYVIYAGSGNDYLPFTDIFKANGIFVTYNSIINYSPISKKYEVAYMHNNIEETLNYIQSLKQINSIKTKDDINIEDLHTTNYILSFQADLDEYYGGFYLEGDNTQFLIEIRPGTNFIALLSETPNKKEMFDSFINKFMFTLEGNLALSYGIPNINYKLIENNNLNEKIIVINNYSLSREAGDEGIRPIGFYCSIYTGNLKKSSSEVHESAYEDIKSFTDYYEQEKNNFINVSYSLSLDSRKEFNKEFDEIASTAIFNFLNEDISTSDTISYFMNEFKKLGGLSELEKANSLLGD